MKNVIRPAALALCCLWMVGAHQQTFGSPSFQTANFYDGTEADSQEIGNRIPLILVHGIREDATIWQSFVAKFWLSPSDVRNHFKPYVFQYATKNSDITSDPSNPIDVTGIGVALGTFLQQWYAKPTTAPDYGFNGNKVAILSHSYGGLVSRSMMVNYFKGHLGSDSVSLLVTLATPHHGTPAANVENNFTTYFGAVGNPLGVPSTIVADMIWDCYDGNSNYGCKAGIQSQADYPKIVAYGASYTPQVINPISDFDEAGPALCSLGYCANDGIVPLGSALFKNAIPATQQRQVDGSCDHVQICSGEFNIQGGVPIFDAIASDLMTVVPAPPPANTPPSVQTAQATGVTSSSATLNATISSPGSGSIIDARFEYTSGTFPGTVIYSVPVSGSTFSYNVNGLTPNTTYTYHAYAKNSAGLWNQGVNNISFITPKQIPGSYQITATAGANGAIAPNGSVTVSPGAAQAFTATGNSGYTPDQWLVDGALAQTGGGSYTFQNIQASHSVSVTFKADASQTHTLTLASLNPDHGVIVQISPGDLNGNTGAVIPPITLHYNKGTIVSLTAALSVNGVPCRKWILDGADYSVSYYVTSVTMDADHSLTVVYENQYGVTPVAGANGSISPSSYNTQSVDSGGSVTFTATPDPGYVVDQWFVGPTLVATGVSSYTLNNVTYNAIVTVSFKAIPVATHTLTLNSSPSAGAIVTVTPADNNGSTGGVFPQTLKYTANVNVTVTTALSVGNDNFQKWQLDGVDFSTAFSIQITPDADHTLTAFYGPGPFAVTPVAGLNGSISPSTAQEVNNGGNVSFVATPSGHYSVDTWFVNNAAAQVGGGSFTLTNVTNNAVVLVTFTPPKLAATWTSAGITLTFMGTLQKATQPGGPYTDVVGASPQTISFSEAGAVFFRAKQ